MFEEGEKVILVTLDEMGAEQKLYDHCVKLYGVYEVHSCNTFYNSSGELKQIVELNGISGGFYGDRFISLVEFRKQKINKILNK
jgi:hypothetical protein